MDFSSIVIYTLILGLLILMMVFAFELMNGNRLESPLEITKRLQGIETTTKWNVPIAKETSVTKSKTSFSAVPTDEERGS